MLGQYEEALSHYNYGVAKNPEFGEIYLNRGIAYVSLFNFHKGIEDFKSALVYSQSGEANKFKILLNLGINLRRVGQL
jgi:tetratricopeptide (TPR) repeat protein